MRRYLLLIPLFLASLAAHPQWQLLNTPTTADLRGIDNVGNGIVWVSGTNGTVLRSIDDGAHWQTCPIPPAAAPLDFRGIQAFDATTAIIMSSGPGDQSRLYKTTDACQTWNLLFTNPDKEGFWDAIQMVDAKDGWMIGDPVHDHFVVGTTINGGQSFSFLTTTRDDQETNESEPLKTSGHGAFAASNSVLLVASPKFSAENRKPFGTPCNYPILWFGTGGPGGAKLYRFFEHRPQCSDYGTRNWTESDTPLAGDTSSAGIFSLASASVLRLIAVGGDYLKPSDSTRTAAFTTDGGKTWHPATTPPHGYRSAVAYSPTTKTWITVGPNGTDISTDDGRNWRPLKPNPQTPNTTPDEDQHWNALSLPFVVGPHGRIGKLRPTALTTP